MKCTWRWPQRALMMWLTLLLAGFMSSAQAAGISIYLQKPADWAAAKIHFFDVLPAGTAANTTWPGVDMKSIGEGWHVQHFPDASSVSMVFNSGTGKQSANLTRTTSGCFKANVWTELASCELPDQPVVLSASPATTSFTTPLSVTLSMLGAADDVKGRYSLDGSDPAETGTEFTNGQVLTLGADEGVGVKSLDDFSLFTQEVRLSSTGENRIDWLVGGFFSTHFSASLDISKKAISPRPAISHWHNLVRSCQSLKMIKTNPLLWSVRLECRLKVRQNS